MKLFVAFNDRGVILAATESRPEAGALMEARPEEVPGAHVEEFDVPAEFKGKRLHELPSLRVDMVARRLAKAEN